MRSLTISAKQDSLFSLLISLCYLKQRKFAGQPRNLKVMANAMTVQFQHQTVATAAAGKSWAVPSALAPPPAAAISFRHRIDRLALRSSFSSLSSLFGLPRSAFRSRITMRVASKQAYICRDCGYIYNERTPFEKLPDNFFCPVCGAPKRRFRPYEAPVAKNANSADVRKARKAELKRDEAIGKALPIAIVVGIAILGGVYYYVNTTF
uniref:Rubredoxin-like domain-containing protein n=1 Tax=Opuntia streptacantha TaxID=393608 RepID=A0A7C9DI87_OPUST